MLVASLSVSLCIEKVIELVMLSRFLFWIGKHSEFIHTNEANVRLFGVAKCLRICIVTFDEFNLSHRVVANGNPFVAVSVLLGLTAWVSDSGGLPIQLRRW